MSYDDRVRRAGEELRQSDYWADYIRQLVLSLSGAGLAYIGLSLVGAMTFGGPAPSWVHAIAAAAFIAAMAVALFSWRTKRARAVEHMETSLDRRQHRDPTLSSGVRVDLVAFILLAAGAALEYFGVPR